jgi:hypothetical protein
VIVAEENVDGLAGKRGPSRKGSVDDAGVRALGQHGDAAVARVRGDEAFVEGSAGRRRSTRPPR